MLSVLGAVAVSSWSCSRPSSLLAEGEFVVDRGRVPHDECLRLPETFVAVVYRDGPAEVDQESGRWAGIGRNAWRQFLVAAWPVDICWVMGLACGRCRTGVR
jgi:hypothetical protein